MTQSQAIMGREGDSRFHGSSRLGATVTCNTCGSEDVYNFSAEIGIHVSGLKHIDVPAVFVFPELVVCLHCGAAQFVIPQEELPVLRKRKATGAG